VADAAPAPSIRHVPGEAGGDFLLERDGKRVGELTYAASGGRMVIHHTGVDPSLRGSGAARRLLDAAVAHARAGGLKVIPRCSYAAAVFARTPEWADLLAGGSGG